MAQPHPEPRADHFRHRRSSYRPSVARRLPGSRRSTSRWNCWSTCWRISAFVRRATSPSAWRASATLRTRWSTVPSLSALYMGYGSGDFFLLRPLRDNAAVRAQFKAPARRCLPRAKHRARCRRLVARRLRLPRRCAEHRRAARGSRLCVRPAYEGLVPAGAGDAASGQDRTLRFLQHGRGRRDIRAPVRWRRRCRGRRSDPSRSVARPSGRETDSVVGAGAVQLRRRGARLRQAGANGTRSRESERTTPCEGLRTRFAGAFTTDGNAARRKRHAPG